MEQDCTTQNNVHWRDSSVICVRLSLEQSDTLPAIRAADCWVLTHALISLPLGPFPQRPTRQSLPLQREINIQTAFLIG